MATFHGHTDFVQAVAFRPDSREIASGGMEGSVKFWDLRTSRPVVFDGHTGWVERLSFRRDGRRVLSEAGIRRLNNEPAKGWDPLTGELDPNLTVASFDQLPADFLPAADYMKRSLEHGAGFGKSVRSPNGKLIATVIEKSDVSIASRSKEYAISSVDLREVASGRLIQTLIGHTADVLGAAFSPDGRRLVTASYDRTIKLWDTATGQAMFTLRGHTAGLLCLTFSPDGNRIVSGAIDHTARVWDATPLDSQVLEAHEARYQRKVTALAKLKDATDDIERGEILAGSGQWAIAAAAFGNAIGREPKSLPLRYKHVIALVESQNRAGVRLACADFLKSRSDSGDRQEAMNVAVFCRLAANAFADQKKLEALRGMAGDSGWAENLIRNGKADLAVLIFEATLELQEPKLGPDHPDVLATRTSLAQAYRAAGRTAEAIGMSEAMLKLKESKLGPDHPDTLAIRNDLILAYRAAGRADDAFRLLERNLKLAESKLGPDHPTTVATRNDLVQAYRSAGRTAEVVAVLEAKLKLYQTKLGVDHPDTLASVHGLAHALEASRAAEAEPLFRRALAGYLKQKVPDRTLTGKLTRDLALLLDRTGQPAKAEPLFRELLDHQRAEHPAGDPALANALAALGTNLLTQRKWAEAEPVIRECLAIREKALADEWSRFNAMSLLGGSLAGQKKYVEAEPLVLAGYDGLKAREAKIPAAGNRRLPEAAERIVQLYESWGKKDKAAKWRTDLAKPSDEPKRQP